MLFDKFFKRLPQTQIAITAKPGSTQQTPKETLGLRSVRRRLSNAVVSVRKFARRSWFVTPPHLAVLYMGSDSRVTP